MKKNGFTLAEILIVMGIIGVVAALTLPSLISDTATAQIGPKLAKAVTVFEQANKALLEEYNVDTLQDTDLLDDSTAYGEALTNHLKINKDDGYYEKTGVSHATIAGPASQAGSSFTSKDGTVYIFATEFWGKDDTVKKTPHKARAGIVWIDINGTKTPNALATDVFVFQLMNDGSLQPGGSTFLHNLTKDEGGLGGAPIPHWSTECPIDKTPNKPEYCAGHIFDNNLKVLYH